MTKCFNWQKSNSISLFKQEDKIKTSANDNMISFENTELVKRYAYKDSLDYAYFLKQGRPFFAYYFFVQTQLNKFGKIHNTL